MKSSMGVDRYVSFCDIECNRQAERVIAHLNKLLSAKSGDSRWQHYFTEKMAQKARMGHDDLFFIGAQMNPLYEYFESAQDGDATDMLWRIEQECC